MTDWTKHLSDPNSTFGADSPAPKVVPSNTVAQVHGIANVPKKDLTVLANAAKTLGIPTDWLATVMAFESGGTFSPSVLNKAGSGAFGLIQFMPSTAAHLLGYPDTTDGRNQAVAVGKAMSFKDQVEKMVIPYLKPHMPFKDLNSVYLAIFYPAAAPHDDSYVVGTAPGAVYTQNKGFDKEGKGYITRADITSTINSVLNSALNLPRLTVSATGMGQILAGLVISGGLGYYFYKNGFEHPFKNFSLKSFI